MSDNFDYDAIENPPDTRAELRAAEDAEDANSLKEWLKRSRKAVGAGVSAFAGSFGLAVVTITGDGIWTWAETIPVLTIAGGIGLSVAFITWQIPNKATT